MARRKFDKRRPAMQREDFDIAFAEAQKEDYTLPREGDANQNRVHASRKENEMGSTSRIARFTMLVAAAALLGNPRSRPAVPVQAYPHHRALPGGRHVGHPARARSA